MTARTKLVCTLWVRRARRWWKGSFPLGAEAYEPGPLIASINDSSNQLK